MTVPDLVGRSVPDAIGIAQQAGLRLEEQTGRARNDDKIPRGRVLMQQPEGGSLAKPAQAVRVVLSLGPRELRVPDLAGLAPRAAALKLNEETLNLGTTSWYRDALARVGNRGAGSRSRHDRRAQRLGGGPDQPGATRDAVRDAGSRRPGRRQDAGSPGDLRVSGGQRALRVLRRGRAQHDSRSSSLRRARRSPAARSFR